ncbi:transposase [Streptomyces sp. NPDC057486]|uniref:transposase n=1 Tax=Streptomyces sp. NPDC057486 TaxID=3346145 RepID=UPI0036CA473D
MRGPAVVGQRCWGFPASWTDDRERCRAAGSDDAVPFATENEHFRMMLRRAVDAGVPFASVAADEAYGQVKHTRLWLEKRTIPHVMATKVNNMVITTNWREERVDDHLMAALPRQRWKRISGGQGAYGERIYDWASVAIRPCWENGFGHWVLARRSAVLSTGGCATYVRRPRKGGQRAVDGDGGAVRCSASGANSRADRAQNEICDVTWTRSKNFHLASGFGSCLPD